MDETNWLWVSEIIRTAPVGMQTTHYFLNALVAFWSSEKPHALKQRLNAIEEELGRDRNDPERRQKDHTIDIDIIEHTDRPWFSGQGIAEKYFRNLFESHLDSCEILVSVELDGYVLGRTPVTICRVYDTDYSAYLTVVE